MSNSASDFSSSSASELWTRNGGRRKGDFCSNPVKSEGLGMGAEPSSGWLEPAVLLPQPPHLTPWPTGRIESSVLGPGHRTRRVLLAFPGQRLFSGQCLEERIFSILMNFLNRFFFCRLCSGGSSARPKFAPLFAGWLWLLYLRL